MTTDLAPYAATVTAIGPDAPSEQIVAAIVLIDGLMQRAKGLKADLEAAAVEWIKANGEFEVGDVRYYVGCPKETKCGDVPATAEELMTRCEGDFARFCSMLVAQPFKPGACEKLFEESSASERFGELFVTTRDPKLKLGKADKRFAKG